MLQLGMYFYSQSYFHFSDNFVICIDANLYWIMSVRLMSVFFLFESWNLIQYWYCTINHLPYYFLQKWYCRIIITILWFWYFNDSTYMILLQLFTSFDKHAEKCYESAINFFNIITFQREVRWWHKL